MDEPLTSLAFLPVSAVKVGLFHVLNDRRMK